MSTRFELLFEGERAAGESALALVEECDARYSLFRSDSLLARVNRDAFERPVRLDQETFELLQACAELRVATDGAFDVCVEPRMRAWGFHPGAREGPIGGYELDPSARAIRFTTPNTALDLGGIVKGHALDLAAASLREHGVARALLHGGTSSVIAIGAPPGERGWRVALGREANATVVELCDDALSVSAPRGRVVEQGGDLIGHILDPRNGVAVPLGIRAAVVHPSARTAEAWSKALLVHALRGTVARAPSEAAAYLLGERVGPVA